MEDQQPPEPRWITGPSPGTAGSFNIVASANYALERFRQLGIPFPTPNRLLRAVETVERISAAHVEAFDLQSLRDAIRTIYDGYFIARACGGDGPIVEPELKNQIARMLSGPDLSAHEDENSSRARNAQFELLLGAWFTSGGTAVRLAEPDVRIVIGEEEVGIAAKRIRSRGQIRKRVRKAVAQVLKAPGRGFPALCVDNLLDDLERLGDPDELGRQFDRAFPEFEEEIARLEREPRISGLLVMGTRTGWDVTSTPPRLDIGTFVKFRALARSEEEGPLLDAFWDHFWTIQAERMKTF